MPTYASLNDLKDFVGAARVAGMIADDPTEHGEIATKLLEAASSEMDSAFEFAGYSTPITPSGNLASLMVVYCCALAIRKITQKLVDEPEGIKKTADAAEAWLLGIRKGTVTLAGIVKSVTLTTTGRLGSIAFEPTGELNLPRYIFPSHTMFAGGRIDE